MALVLAGCSGGAGAQTSDAQGGAAESGASSVASASAPSGVSGAPDAVGSGGGATVASAGASTGGSAQGGAVAAAGGGQGVAIAGGGSSDGGSANAGSGGASPNQAGSAGGGDPLEPFPAPGCDGWAAYRIPPGKFLAITGSFESTLLKNGSCTEPVGTPSYESCSAPGNVSQCVCTVTSPPSCGQSCDGEYLVTALKAEPGKAFHAELLDGDGHCIAGVPVAK